MQDYVIEYLENESALHQPPQQRWIESMMNNTGGDSLPPSTLGELIFHKIGGTNMVYRRVPRDPLVKALVLAQQEDK